MADYVEILDSQIDGSSPGDSDLFFQLRDNPEAIATGEVGATNLLLGVASKAVAGGVGTYVFARTSPQNGQALDSTVSGSALIPTAAICNLTDSDGTGTVVLAVGSALSGTWRCMGVLSDTVGTGGLSGLSATLYLRIS